MQINVVCGVILYKNKILISKRSKKKEEYAYRWELPGGKVNKNENLKNALIREIKEELNIDIIINKLLYIVKKVNNKYNVYYYLCKTNLCNIKKNNEISVYKLINKLDYINIKMMPNDHLVLNYYNHISP
jgi:8-oxo-dGTP diphosphatase